MLGFRGRRTAPPSRAWWAVTAVVALGLAAGAVAAPASAEDNRLSVIAQPQLALPLGPSDAQNPVKTVEVVLNRSNLQVPTEGTLTIDTSELSGVADVTWPAVCTPFAAGGGAECATPHSPGSPSDTVLLHLKAAAGAHNGATGVMHYTGHASDTADAHGQTQVTVQAGADVELIGVPGRLKTTPGSTLTLPFALANHGGEPGGGTALFATPSRSLDSLPRFGNCYYEFDGAVRAGKVSLMMCVLPPVAPGATASYRGLTFTAGAGALIEDVEFGAQPYTADVLASMRKQYTLVQGTGPDLAPDGSAALPGGAPYMGDVKVDVANTADLALSVPQLTGKKGAVVKAAVSVANQGPADYADTWGENPIGYVEFRPPPGTTVVDLYEGCAVYDAHGKQLKYGVPGVRYLCPLSFLFPSGGSEAVGFKLRIDKVVANATGSAALTRVEFDPNTKNNSAKVVLNAVSGGTATGGTSGGGHGSSSGGAGTTGTSGGTLSGGAGTTGTSGGTPGPTDGPGGSTDGDLAATGSDPVALIGGIAMGCGLLGGTVLLVLRSRRRRAA
jgi:hypothetical protein